MQTAKDKTIAGMLAHLGGLNPTEKRVADMAYDAGYMAAREDAAKLFEFGSTFRRIDVVDAIRKLEPSNLASEQEAANSSQD